MRLDSKKRLDQEYFATWDKKIETTSMYIVVNMAKMVIIFILLNIFIIVMLSGLNVYNLPF
jgi:hypothetical protein